MDFEPDLRILCAGMHRSGSTWLFNTLRMIYISSNTNVYSYFFSLYYNYKGQAASIHIAKTHQFEDVLTTPHRYDYIFTTCRDIRDVAGSAVRFGLIENRTRTILLYLRKLISEEYDTWSSYSNMEIVYEQMIKDKIGTTRQIAQFLGVDVEPSVVHRAVETLPLPKKGEDYFRDTQLHYRHVTCGIPGSYNTILSDRTISRIEKQFSAWLLEHNYQLVGRQNNSRLAISRYLRRFFN